MNSFIPWTGGKKNLREAAVLRFPLKYERYIEVFGGGGWVLFHKPQTSFVTEIRTVETDAFPESEIHIPDVASAAWFDWRGI